MSIQKINPATTILLLFMTVAAALRIWQADNTLSPLANFTPIGAMGLFGGTYFNQPWKKWFFPLAALLLSDAILMHTIYAGYSNGLLYKGWMYTYLAFAVIVLIGTLIKHVKISTVITAAVAAAIAHWLITDLPVWWFGGLDIRNGQHLQRNWDGLVQCYVQALPYLRNMLVANIMYCTIFYGSFEWLQKRLPSSTVAIK
jgi:hypothetical protein